MDAFDKFANIIANCSDPFKLAHNWGDIQTGFAALAKWKAETDARLKKLEDSAVAKG